MSNLPMFKCLYEPKARKHKKRKHILMYPVKPCPTYCKYHNSYLKLLIKFLNNQIILYYEYCTSSYKTQHHDKWQQLTGVVISVSNLYLFNNVFVHFWGTDQTRRSTYPWHGLLVPCFFLCPWTYDSKSEREINSTPLCPWLINIQSYSPIVTAAARALLFWK